ncbi:MAR-binding filament-like protein 1-1 [Cinnamomum micranthum f. kanehirae]|uniref:MAR-binding filament-like protein 1-1 n=1 Tax=Cinnamomum micranthum f. kanehirae TaxID=337451 RepID=A0A3S3Q2M7_9MAGN|nr:MAR-binding filament-like protein 1-1 [Cinnamomum micranthum f. kanehirae]
MATMGKNFKGRLQGKREVGIEEIGMAKEDLDSASNQLDSAGSALTELQQELQSEKKLTQDIGAQIDHLQGVIAQAGEDKRALEAEVGLKQDAIDILQQRINQLSLEIEDKEISIENLNLSLAGKESECKDPTSIYNQTKEDLAQANSAVEGLMEEVRKIREELELKKSLEEDLTTRLKLLVTERDDINKKVHVLHEEYNDLMSGSAKRAAPDAGLSSNKYHELNRLKHHPLLFTCLLLLLSFLIYATFLHDLGKANTTKVEQEHQLRAPANSFVGFLNGVGIIGCGVLGALYALARKETTSLNSVIESMKNKLSEKEATQETLGASRLEAADFLEQLNQSNRSREELTSEVSRIQAESEEVQKSLNQNLDEVKLSLKQRSDELVSIKEALMKTKQELLVMTDELKDAMEAREDLNKELLEVNKKSERTANDLKEEKRLVASLNEEVAELRKRTSEDKDARVKLERDLQEAAKSLKEMNRKALTLSRELEMANSKCANLESEKDMLAKSLAEEKNFAKEVRENIEVAQKSLTDVHVEMENLEKRSEELQVELATAKAEIEKLKREATSGRWRRRLPIRDTAR